MKKIFSQLIFVIFALLLFTVFPFSANADTGHVRDSQKPSTISDSITMTISKQSAYSKPKRYHTSAKSHISLYKAHIFSHATKVTFKLIGFSKADTTYKITKVINAQGLNWYYLKGHGWIIGGTHPSHGTTH
ncbi:MAG: hypothetical protein ABF723_00700 [Lentilactobacillus hilgardii]|jgi:hypothetical protein|uniref:Uncharacterized protein n=1 Tax=Lentilactobacillus hilgardii TaxID=1588 RepID=A0A6P1E162_LENHI|nr:hypothetical protein [Lentilactobacillus hilgardii]MCI2019660.1 hypothetical protein [Lentilactobacillus buchneri]RRG11795.1 MAG: hypothetical protein DUD35_04645 [Lactobacillus sp.]EEI72209.1 hypothetical protein HMPREF0496_0655 [Lentilactobacillus hilgardii ATCC 27305]MBZ2201226.1 hypothetical protein [Lentilactobacillus hilgardii]MBZ2205346.1 hypothetical protein [Lentilactobacillus hilgardii]